jgi:hypothetical protein
VLVRLYSYTNATVEMLAKLGLTEDRFNAMSPADQQKIEDKVREMIKQQIQNTSDKRGGSHRQVYPRRFARAERTAAARAVPQSAPESPAGFCRSGRRCRRNLIGGSRRADLHTRSPGRRLLNRSHPHPRTGADRVFAKSPRRLIGTRSQSKEKHL